MGIRAGGVAVFVAGAVLWAMSGTQREKPVLAATHVGSVAALEADVAAHPDADSVRALAQGYLDARQPGLAVALVEGMPPEVRSDVLVRHIYARALIDEGRDDDALSVEDTVVTSCRPMAEAGGAVPGCTPSLLGSAIHRRDVLRELVSMGVEDTRAHPEVSLLAYEKATRQARIMVQ